MESFFAGLVQSTVDFVKAHQLWAPFIVGALAFGESLAFISLLLPSWGVLVAMGALISAGAIDFIPVWIAGAIGAALGDWLSYWLGDRYKQPIAHVWPLSRYPDLLPRGHAFVEKWGIYAIFIGRFFGPLRASVPLVAGIFEMPYWHFQLANFASAFVWCAVLLKLGDVGMQVWTMASEWLHRVF